MQALDESRTSTSQEYDPSGGCILHIFIFQLGLLEGLNSDLNKLGWAEVVHDKS